MDKRIRPFEDIAPTNVRKLLFCLFPRSLNGPYRTDLFLSRLWILGIRKLNIKKSVSLLISSFDSIDETDMDFGLTFTMYLKWQEWLFGLVNH